MIYRIKPQVVLAQAGTQCHQTFWIPASAGMTI
jgi:hypothetical protein